MPFDPFTWALGYSLSTGANYLREKLFSTGLQRELESTVSKWAQKLPRARAVVPEALFLQWERSTQLEELRPSLERLHSALLEKTIPSPTLWEEAFVEQWETVRKKIGPDAQPFFLASQEDVRNDLRLLAKQIHAVCIQDEELFKQTVVSRLSELARQAPAEDLALDTLARQLEDTAYALMFALERLSALLSAGVQNQEQGLTADETINNLAYQMRAKAVQILDQLGPASSEARLHIAVQNLYQRFVSVLNTKSGRMEILRAAIRDLHHARITHFSKNS